MLEVNYGFFKSTNVPEIHENAREVYKEYYRNIRGTIPEEKLLEYTIASP